MCACVFATDKLFERAFNADMIKFRKTLRLNRVTCARKKGDREREWKKAHLNGIMA